MSIIASVQNASGQEKFVNFHEVNCEEKFII